MKCRDCNSTKDLATDDCGTTLCVKCASQYNSSEEAELGIKKDDGKRFIYIVRNCAWEEHGTPTAFEDLETAKAQPYAETIWVVELNNPKGPYDWYWSPERTHDHAMKEIPRDKWNWVEYKYEG